jgi:hypothetical protein
MPVLQIHGTADTVVKYSGVAATITGWLNKDGCPQTAQVTQPYPASNASSTVKKDYYGPCNQSSEVILLSVGGAGHVWPGGYGATFGINAGEEIWAFFKNHSLSTATISPSAKPLDARMNISAFYSDKMLHVESDQEVRSIRVLDIQGRTMVSTVINHLGNHTKSFMIPIPRLVAGMSVIVLNLRDRKNTVTLIVP